MTAVATVSRDGDDLVVRPLVGALPEVKTLGATWDRARDAWKLPASMMHLRSLEDLLGDVEVEPADGPYYFANEAGGPPVVDERLYDWQTPRAQRLVDARRGLLLCAAPGLGKTAMAIVAADVAAPGDQVVVVATAKLVRMWARAIREWGTGDTSVAIVAGKPDWDAVRAARWVLVSWDLLSLHADWFAGKWPLWILDESVVAKSRRSTRSLALRGGTRRKRKADGTIDTKRWANLRRGIDRVWLLSGSPTTRHADDLWAQLNLIWPRAFPSYWRFAERYCVVEENRWASRGTVVGTKRGMDAVADNADLIEVVDQESVIDLPEYLFEPVVEVTLTRKQALAYEEMTRDFLTQLDSGEVVDADNRMAQLVRLQQIVSYWDGESAKHDALLELVESGAYEPPYLVWTHWREGAIALAERLARSGLTVGHALGGLSGKTADDIVEAYKAGKSDALVLSLGVGKFGLTLVNTRTVFYVDKTWNADDYYQSLLRVRRIGLGHRPVLLPMRAPGTVDELLELNLEGKIEGIARVTNARLSDLISGLGGPSAGPASRRRAGVAR